MITLLRSNYRNQLLLLAATAAAAWWTTTSWAFAPVVRIGTGTLVQGLAAGLLTAIFSLLIQTLLMTFSGTFRSQYQTFGKSLYAGSIFAVIGATVATVVAQEVLLRGLLFSFLERDSIVLAFAVNAAASAAIWIRSRQTIWPAIIMGIEGTLFAVIFWYNHSLFLVLVAHAVADAAAAAAYGGRLTPLTAGAADWISIELLTKFGIKVKRRRDNR